MLPSVLFFRRRCCRLFMEYITDGASPQVGVGGVLVRAGPLSLILGYIFWGFLFVWPCQLCVAEMLAYLYVLFELSHTLVVRTVSHFVFQTHSWNHFRACGTIRRSGTRVCHGLDICECGLEVEQAEQRLTRRPSQFFAGFMLLCTEVRIPSRCPPTFWQPSTDFLRDSIPQWRRSCSTGSPMSTRQHG